MSLYKLPRMEGYILVFLFVLFLASCGGSKSPPSSNVKPMPQIMDAPEQNAILDADKLPSNINPNLGNGAHKQLVQQAYQLPMQSQFLSPQDRPYPEYAVEQMEVSLFQGDQQIYLNYDVQQGIATVDPQLSQTSKLEVLAPRGFLVNEGLELSSIKKYTFGFRQDAWVLENLASILELFVIDTSFTLLQETKNQVKLDAQQGNRFRVILLDAREHTQFWFGARRDNHKIHVYLRFPTADAGNLKVIKFTLAPIQEIQVPFVIRYPLTYDEWLVRTRLQPQILIDDLNRFGVIDDFRRREVDLIYNKSRGVVEFSTKHLRPAVRQRLLAEVNLRPELLFVTSVLTDTFQLTVAPLRCPNQQNCTNIGDLAKRVDADTLIMKKRFFNQGNTMLQFLTAVVYSDQAALSQRFPACFQNEEALNLQVKIQELKKLREQKASILKKLKKEQNRLPAAGMDTPFSLWFHFQTRQLQNFLMNLDDMITETETEETIQHVEQLLSSSNMLLAVGDVVDDTEAVEINVKSFNDNCAQQLQQSYNQIAAIEDERNRQVELITGYPKDSWRKIGYDRTAYQFDMIPAASDLVTTRILHEGEAIGFKSALFKLNDPSYGLRVIFAIRNDRQILQRRPDGETVNIRAVDFMMQRVNSDLKNVHYADHTLVFDWDIPDVMEKAFAWIRSEMPHAVIRELVLDTHGTAGVLLWGTRWVRLGQMHRQLAPLRDVTWTNTPNIFINACEVARDGAALVSMTNDLGLHKPITVMASDEVYRVSKREMVVSTLNENATFVLQHTQGSLAIGDWRPVERAGEARPAKGIWDLLTRGMGAWLLPEEAIAADPQQGSTTLYRKKSIGLYRDIHYQRAIQSTKGKRKTLPNIQIDRLMNY